MRTRGDIGEAVGSVAKASGVVGDQSGEAGSAVDAPVDDDVTGRALRMLQLHDDARQEFEHAEEKLKTVRLNIDRALAGDIDRDDPAPLVVAAGVAEPAVNVIAAPRHSRYLAASVVLAGLVAGWAAMSAIEATRDPDVAASRRAIVSEAVAAVAPVRDEVPAGARDQADFGQTLYAARFAHAPAAERTCLARAVYYEARGEEMAGQIAVAQVVLNRARSKKWPDTICGVVNQGIERGEKCQFSFACFSRLSQPSGEMWEQAQQVADQALRGQAWLRELVEATYYHTTNVAPVWRVSLTEIATIGTHVFYRDGEGLNANTVNVRAYEAVAATQAARAKVVTLTKAVRPKSIAGEAAGLKNAPVRRGDDWKSNIFGQ
ncbi:MAG: cell wall hydrolase [Hyphomicrobiaceae bacterium]